MLEAINLTLVKKFRSNVMLYHKSLHIREILTSKLGKCLTSIVIFHFHPAMWSKLQIHTIYKPSDITVFKIHQKHQFLYGKKENIKIAVFSLLFILVNILVTFLIEPLALYEVRAQSQYVLSNLVMDTLGVTDILQGNL